MTKNLVPLVDGDILLYEIGFGAETGWRAITNDPEAIPPFNYVEDMLLERLSNISAVVGTDAKPIIYITDEKPTFRFDLAKTKPYKGTRKGNKPWHYANLKAYMYGCLDANRVEYLEADDMMAIVQTCDPKETIICSRDKDLKQVPGWHYSWELGKQPQFGPEIITKLGTLKLSDDKKKLSGTGLLFFYAQMLTGDTVDNIPGLPRCGPVAAYDILNTVSEVELLDRVIYSYQDYYKDEWEAKMIEQGQLCWIVRRFEDDPVAGMLPQVWYPGLEE